MYHAINYALGTRSSYFWRIILYRVLWGDLFMHISWARPLRGVITHTTGTRYFYSIPTFLLWQGFKLNILKCDGVILTMDLTKYTAKGNQEGNDNNRYIDVIMGTIVYQITSLTVVYSTVYSDADQRKYQSSASLTFVWGNHRRPVNTPHNWPVTWKMVPFHDVIMNPPFRTSAYNNFF